MKNNLVKLGILACVITVIISLAGCGSSRKNIAYDKDGFLGYSDSFWEWYADNN